MEILWIRHGMTEGNQKKKYIGRTEEPLCKEGKEQLRERQRAGWYPDAGRIFVSPRKRCVETAGILYPHQRAVVISGFAECDFGRFENKNYEQLKASAYYQEWLQSNGTMPFPGGESQKEFTDRCIKGFYQMVSLCQDEETVACIVHGGTIMAVLSALGVEGSDYYSYQCGNGEGYRCEAVAAGRMGQRKVRKLRCIRPLVS